MMILNAKTHIIGAKVILVPYKAQHVVKYHEWMKSSELQYLTGSEPLTIYQEYEMQRTWENDENKCTFIVLDRGDFLKTTNQVNSMIGDTNLYLNDSNGSRTAECEIMIAEKKARGHRMGWEAMILMLRYGIDLLKVNKFCAKIKMDNEQSINMFRKLQFHQTSRSAVFQEITFQRSVDEDWSNWLESETYQSIRKGDE